MGFGQIPNQLRRAVSLPLAANPTIAPSSHCESMCINNLYPCGLNPSQYTEARLQATNNLLVSSVPKSSVRLSSKAQGEEKSTCNMPLAALAASGAFALGRSASDKRARKQEDRASQRGLPSIPEIDRKDANSAESEKYNV